MSGVEAGLVKLGQAVASYAVRSWLADRRRRDERRLALAELVNRRVTDGFAGRRFVREVESMADTIAERMIPLAHSDRVGLPEHERLAALDAVVDAFTLVAGDDEVLFAADADADKLTGLVLGRAQGVPRQAGLGERAYRLYEVVLAECCQSYVQAVVSLGPFTPRATAELLSRFTSQSEQLARILSRLPVRTLDAPAGTAEDAEFRRRYLDLISTGLDEVVLFGVSTRHRPRVPLSLAYVSLSMQVTSVVARRESLPDRIRPPAGITQDVSMRVEQALSRASRTLIHGEAGSARRRSCTGSRSPRPGSGSPTRLPTGMVASRSPAAHSISDCGAALVAELVTAWPGVPARGPVGSCPRVRGGATGGRREGRADLHRLGPAGRPVGRTGASS